MRVRAKTEKLLMQLGSNVCCDDERILQQTIYNSANDHIRSRDEMTSGESRPQAAH